MAERETAWLVAAVAALVASAGLVGADALWLVPLGREVAHGHVPGSIPFAVAPTHGWHDVAAAAQLLFWAVYSAFGEERGLVLLQTIAAAVGFGALARGLRRETTGGTVLVVCAIVLAGTLPAVAVTSVSLFSLAFFPLLLLLLEEESRKPSRRIWLAVVLLALWGNLHGGVLAGWALLVCYLVLERARRRLAHSLLLLAAGTVTLLANPALWHTPSYYRRVFTSEVARHGTELWAPLGFGPLDVLLIVAAAALVLLAIVRGPRIRLWELVALVGLAVETVHVARTGVWFLFLAAYPAARGVRLRTPRPRLLAVATVAIALGVGVSIARGPVPREGRSIARIAARTGKPILAEPILGQLVALDGGRIWVDNPIDAFTRRDQRLYLDWLAGNSKASAAVRHVGYVLVSRGSKTARAATTDPRLKLAAWSATEALYRVVGR
jgi:hypothetical protein